MIKKKYTISKESYKDDFLGDVSRDGSMASFNVPICISGFKNMQEVKDFLRKNRGKMQRVLEKYCELSMNTKFLDQSTVAKGENKMVEIILRKLGYIS